MTWLLVIIAAWIAVAVVVALLIGRTVHTADVIEHTDASADPAQAAPRDRGDDAEPPAAGAAGYVAFLPRKAFAAR